MSASVGWIYCRLVDRGNFIFPRMPFWFGQVEFSADQDPEAACAAALAESIKAHAVAVDDPSEAPGDGPTWRRFVRARLLLLNESDESAMRSGDFHVSEHIQAFNAHVTLGFARIKLTDAGYLLELNRRRVRPLLPPFNRDRFGGTSAIMDAVAHHPLHVLNTLYSAPAAYKELGDAFRRSSHWRELASTADDEGEALLLYWMSAECLCKEQPDDDITPKLLAASGFPTGRILASVPKDIASRVSSIPNHRQWRKQLATLFRQLRVARNHIVHAGFRHVDLPALLGEEQRALGMSVLPRVSKSLASMALLALNHRIVSLEDMWARYHLVIDPNGLERYAAWSIERLESAN